MSENSGMKDVIHTINQLQDVLTSTGVSLGLDLPQIAVQIVPPLRDPPVQGLPGGEAGD